MLTPPGRRVLNVVALRARARMIARSDAVWTRLAPPARPQVLPVLHDRAPRAEFTGQVIDLHALGGGQRQRVPSLELVLVHLDPLQILAEHPLAAGKGGVIEDVRLGPGLCEAHVVLLRCRERLVDQLGDRRQHLDRLIPRRFAVLARAHAINESTRPAGSSTSAKSARSEQNRQGEGTMSRMEFVWAPRLCECRPDVTLAIGGARRDGPRGQDRGPTTAPTMAGVPAALANAR